MMIIGVDYHPSFEVVAFLVEETGECGEQELNHSEGQAEKFYRDLQWHGGYRIFTLVRATAGRTRFELWIGDPAEIKAKRVKKQHRPQ